MNVEKIVEEIEALRQAYLTSEPGEQSHDALLAYNVGLAMAWPTLKQMIESLAADKERLTREGDEVPQLAPFLGLTNNELKAEDIQFLREDNRVSMLERHHPAGIVRALCAMVNAEKSRAEAAEADAKALREAIQELVRLKALQVQPDIEPVWLKGEMNLAWRIARSLSHSEETNG